MAEEKHFVKYYPLVMCQGLLFLISRFIKDKSLGLRKRKTHLVDKGANKVNEADLKLGEFVRLVSVHHGLS